MSKASLQDSYRQETKPTHVTRLGRRNIRRLNVHSRISSFRRRSGESDGGKEGEDGSDGEHYG